MKLRSQIGRLALFCVISRGIMLVVVTRWSRIVGSTLSDEMQASSGECRGVQECILARRELLVRRTCPEPHSCSLACIFRLGKIRR